MSRQISYKLHQRREGETLHGQYHYIVTTVISGVYDAVSGVSIPATGAGEEPLLSLFLMDTQNCHSTSDKLVEDTILFNRIATPEDFSSTGDLVGGGTWLGQARAFFPSSSSTDPTVGTPIAPSDLELGNLSIIIPPGHTGGTPPYPFYVSNVRIDAFLTVEDADLAATEIRNAIDVFRIRYNEIAASFGTSDPSDVNNYREYTLPSS